MLAIYEVMDGKVVVAVEIHGGEKVWFWEIEQKYFQGLRMGAFPPKSWNEDFSRRLMNVYGRTEAIESKTETDAGV